MHLSMRRLAFRLLPRHTCAPFLFPQPCLGTATPDVQTNSAAQQLLLAVLTIAFILEKQTFRAVVVFPHTPVDPLPFNSASLVSKPRCKTTSANPRITSMPNTAPLQQAVQQCRMLRAFTCRQLGHGSPGSPGAAPRTVVVRSQSNRRYSSRYTRDDTQEINSRRSTSSWEEDKDYSSRDSWSNADQDARAWERDNYYDDREGSRTETNSWSSGYDERRYDDDRSYTNRDDRYSSSYNGGNGSSSSSSWGGYERDAPSSSPSSSSSWGDYGSSSSSGYGGSSSSSGYGGYDSYSRSSSYDRPTPTYPGFSGECRHVCMSVWEGDGVYLWV